MSYATITRIMELKIKKLHAGAQMPTYAHEGDAGLDLIAVQSLTIPAGGRVVVPVGIAVEIPDGFVGLVWDKSGLATIHGLKTVGGVIDSGYRGELKVGVVNLNKEDYVIDAGQKIAQLLIQRIERVTVLEVAELSGTVRGEGGFGSTGK